MALSPQFMEGFLLKCAELGVDPLAIVEQYAKDVMIASSKEAELVKRSLAPLRFDEYSRHPGLRPNGLYNPYFARYSAPKQAESKKVDSKDTNLNILSYIPDSIKSKAISIGKKIKEVAAPYKEPLKEFGVKTVDTAKRVKDIFTEQISGGRKE